MGKEEGRGERGTNYLVYGVQGDLPSRTFFFRFKVEPERLTSVCASLRKQLIMKMALNVGLVVLEISFSSTILI